MKIIFMGTPEFAVPSLQALIDHHHEIVTVISQPDRRQGRGRKLKAPPVKELAVKKNIPVLQPTRLKDQDLLTSLKKLKADLMVVVAYGRILPAVILNITPSGAINVHGSILPAYRGAAPIQRAILNGESQTGVTIMQLDEGMDTGDILLTTTLTISDDDTSLSLAIKMAELGSNALIEALAKLEKNDLPPTRQDESRASTAPPLTKDEAAIDWHQPARAISCQIRGLDPWPKASTTMGDKWLRLYQVEVVNQKPQKPAGTIIRADKNGLLIACGQQALLAKEVQLEGSRRMKVEAFLCGNEITVDTVLG